MAEEELMTMKEVIEKSKKEEEEKETKPKSSKKLKKPLVKKRKIPFTRKLTPPSYTREQNALRQFFGGHGEPLWGTGRDLPRLHGGLIGGFGLIKSGDKRRETAGLFGL